MLGVLEGGEGVQNLYALPRTQKRETCAFRARCEGVPFFPRTSCAHGVFEVSSPSGGIHTHIHPPLSRLIRDFRNKYH